MKETSPVLIKNAKVYTETTVIESGNVLMDEGKIVSVHPSDEMPSNLPEGTQIIDAKGLAAIPGFIDGHIHGANGADVMDATEAALDTMASVLPKEGTTSFLATTITQAPEQIEAALINVRDYMNKGGQAEVIGVHLEGPFIEKKKAGAQPLQHIKDPDEALFDRWQELSGEKIKTITMAPELDPDGSFIKKLAAEGINVSAGHTDANYSLMQQAVKHGVRQVTHLCNAMNGIHHRDIGAVGAAMELEELRAELIADGIHVVPEMLQLIYRNIGSERLLLITDAMRAKCLPAGEYELGGQPVHVSSDRALLDNGTLAGSILKMQEGAQNMLRLTDVSMKNIVEMTAVNPAKQINIYDRKGSITPGKDADVLLVDEHLDIKYTFCRGIIAFKGDKQNGID
ncbi:MULTISPECIES: N-acetylglucosamine-6-phosphate deacetylase [Virgibacillus]|uniref:N-acetylglucosamine-6-phosphate deacetylase n=1 Tax=Virgibacillus pantothenticus TaxID=1473 RepID=A0A0L0QMG2_VIRPA|nr:MULTISPECIES: N-acetylglucosamine-6-phosphate deacetylase [Virgibacillus]API93434.1 N-acetylglucosamine-6-phosphate deacetylase [Virgibacillus sp. 6R]KNE19751.1 N-acetylglucosamine-6-phosphate deacetylase [Virgibacillus pantothenticus]MBS7430193.1 N-acetylglucosamine-6-phosphate deacetylase [Virgibacillus sp. 19R1-5]MED3738898.1 N-acetylglucosamine-6-phosphate deacetylase [Virgibacillus pantothenticus]QTY14710.1 N-acetylglucosamine-6-phosphate deacetylase [Virgibacillus pantothenticus]